MSSGSIRLPAAPPSALTALLLLLLLLAPSLPLSSTMLLSGPVVAFCGMCAKLSRGGSALSGRWRMGAGASMVPGLAH
jgi:hypothetical protein